MSIESSDVKIDALNIILFRLQRGLAGGTYFVKPEYRPILKLLQYFLGR